MVTPTKTIARLALLAIVVAGPGAAQDMPMRLEPTVSVPLDFLDWIGRDRQWLAEQVQGKGVSVAPKGDVAQVGTMDGLRAINRIRAFAHLAQPGLRPPYLDLRLDGPDNGRCVTQFASGIVAGIKAEDFAHDTLSAAEADPVLLEQCLVRSDPRPAWQGLDRQQFRSRYFDASGVLRPEFDDLAHDAAFIAAAIDLGYLVGQEDYSGLPRLEPE